MELDKDGQVTFHFDQTSENMTYYYLRKRGTTMRMRVPKSGGWLQIRYDDTSAWSNLYQVSPY